MACPACRVSHGLYHTVKCRNDDFPQLEVKCVNMWFLNNTVQFLLTMISIKITPGWDKTDDFVATVMKPIVAKR